MIQDIWYHVHQQKGRIITSTLLFTMMPTKSFHVLDRVDFTLGHTVLAHFVNDREDLQFSITHKI